LDRAVEVPQRRWDGEAAAAAEFEEGVGDHAAEDVVGAGGGEVDDVGEETEAEADAEALLEDASRTPAEGEDGEPGGEDEVDAVEEGEADEDSGEQREALRAARVGGVAAGGTRRRGRGDRARRRRPRPGR